MDTDIEREFFSRFLKKERRERFVWMISNTSRRHKIFDDLRDTRHFDPRHCVEITGVDKDLEPILARLRKCGMGGKAYFISSDEAIDGTFCDVTEALSDRLWSVSEILGYCPRSKIGFFKNHEDWFYILRKQHLTRQSTRFVTAGRAKQVIAIVMCGKNARSMIGPDEYDVLTAICRRNDLFLFDNPGGRSPSEAAPQTDEPSFGNLTRRYVFQGTKRPRRNSL